MSGETVHLVKPLGLEKEQEHLERYQMQQTGGSHHLLKFGKGAQIQLNVRVCHSLLQKGGTETGQLFNRKETFLFVDEPDCDKV